MSALEEAREQAREALELVHAWRQREQAWDTPRALGFEKIGQAIRTLLDATEPLPIKPAEDERATLEQAIGYELVPLSIRNHPEIRYEYRTADDRDGLVDRIIASDFRKGPRPITDEMVEAGVNAAWNKRTVGIGGQVVYGPSPEMYRIVRAALEAAEEARR